METTGRYVPDSALHELCRDLAAGAIDRGKFNVRIHCGLRRRLACKDIKMRCATCETSPLLHQLNDLGWLAETVHPWHLLHAALAYKGHPLGVLTGMRPSTELNWTLVDGAVLRRMADLLTTHFGCATTRVLNSLDTEGELP